MRSKCYQHEAVMWPPDDCIDCIRLTYGRDSDKYREARAKKAIRVLQRKEVRQELVIREQERMIRALSDELMAGPRIRELQQEDIDWVYGECDIQDNVWCKAHESRVTRRGRCDAWRDYEDSVETVIDRLKEEQR